MIQPTVPNILLLEDEPDLAEFISAQLEAAGYSVTHVENGKLALESLAESLPELIVSDVMMPGMDGFQFLEQLRAKPRFQAIPLIFLTTKANLEDIVEGLALGADDYLIKPFKSPELIARVHAKLARPPVPAADLRRDTSSGLLGESAFLRELKREHARARRGSYSGIIARLVIPDLPRLRTYFGPRTDRALAAQLGGLLETVADPLASLAHAANGDFLLLMPGLPVEQAATELERLAQAIAVNRFSLGYEALRISPSIGYATFEDGVDVDAVFDAARLAANESAAHLDLRPARFAEEMRAGTPQKSVFGAALDSAWKFFRLPGQMLSAVLLGTIIPYFIYVGLGPYGPPIAGFVYWFIIVAIAMTALLIWAEGFLALKRVDPEAADSYPPASAIIAAYLPNEAATLESTIEAFLAEAEQYPGPLQVILAYNTPQDMPFERVLQDIAARHPHFVSLRVRDSTSKAQNVNAALSFVSGEFTGIFDADHHPDPGSFRRAWDWISDGADIVQGHCFIRNGSASWVAKLVAIEFEQIYAVAHPGRARLHGFGIFGGSNGYWRSELLRQTRFRGSMLTEDIDSSLRVIENGGRIISDPYLVSRELSPTTLEGLTDQRLRWAQGWFQVTKRRLIPLLRSPHLSLRNKLGVFHLLAWREAFPWLSLQIFPIVAYWAVQAGGFDRLDWFIPILFILTIATVATGPGQIFFTWHLADAQHKKHRSWFLHYLWRSLLFYSEYRALIARVAQLKEIAGEKAWKITPRT
jgi:CheY-like chemotaxis protein